MPQITLAFSFFLTVLGVSTWLLTNQTSFTALIPAFFGIGLAVVGFAAITEKMRMHAIHAAAFLALLGTFGSLKRALPSITSAEELGLATMSQLLMAVLLILFLIICVRSFIVARRIS